MVKKTFSRAIAILTGKGTPEGGDPLTLEASLSRIEKFAHFCVLLWNSFVRNRCLVHASSLSFATLLALIPMLAVAISITSSLLKSQGEETIYRFVDKAVAAVVPPAVIQNTSAPIVLPDLSSAPPSGLFDIEPATPASGVTNLTLAVTSTNLPATTNALTVVAGDTRMVTAQKEAARHIHGFIQNIRSGTIGVTGMILLIVVAIRMLSSIEDTFNDIWGVARGRNWFVRIVQYWSVITLGPLLLAFALGLSGGGHFHHTRNAIAEMPVFGGLIFKLLPLVVVWLTFALIYRLVPNTKVHFGAAMIGGVIAGSLWHLNNVFGFLFVSRVFTNREIYGSLFILPVFMAGIYLSWLILLLGAQVAYAFQNRRAYLQEKLIENVNQRGREFIALRLMTCIGQRFQHGLLPATVPEMSAELGIPSKLIQQVLHTLLAARLVVEVAKLEPAYAPARPLEAINAHHILMAMRSAVGQELVSRDEPVRAEVYGEFARIQEAEKQAATSVTMLDLVTRAKARLELEAPSAAKTGEAAPKMVAALAPPPEAIENLPAAPEPVMAAAAAAEQPQPKKQVVIEPEKKPSVAPPDEEPLVAKTESPENIAPVAPTARSATGGDDHFPL